MDGVAVIDVGSTWTKLVVYNDCNLEKIVHVRREQTPRLPGPPGYSQLNPHQLWRLIAGMARDAKRAGATMLSITLHRSSVLAWNERGDPLTPVIVWDDRRVASVYEKTVPFLARFFSKLSVKLGTILSPEAALPRLLLLVKEVQEKEKRFYAWTLDSWILYRATRGEYLGEASHAAVTGLVHPATLKPIGLVAKLTRFPLKLVPEIVDTYGAYGELEGLELRSITSDQQAAIIGDGAVERGVYKVSMGTGLFVDKYVGKTFKAPSREGLVPLVVAKIKGEKWHAVEGFTSTAGSLFDTLTRITGRGYEELEREARRGDEPLIVLPSLQGLQFPRRRLARGAVLGVTRTTSLSSLALGAYTSLALHAAAILFSLRRYVGDPAKTIRVDGGLARSRLILELLAGFTQTLVERVRGEASAKGSAVLACLGEGFSPEKSTGYVVLDERVEPGREWGEGLVELWMDIVEEFSRERPWKKLSELIRALSYRRRG